MDYLRQLGYVESSITRHARHIKEYVSAMERNQITNWQEITADQIRNYLNYLRNRPNKLTGGKLAAKTVNGHYRGIQKERAMLSLNYGCGLRVGELENLEIQDLKTDEGYLIVRKGKGNKRRAVPMSTAVIKDLRNYLNKERPRLMLERHYNKKHDSVLDKQTDHDPHPAAQYSDSSTASWLRHQSGTAIFRTCLTQYNTNLYTYQ